MTLVNMFSILNIKYGVAPVFSDVPDDISLIASWKPASPNPIPPGVNGMELAIWPIVAARLPSSNGISILPSNLAISVRATPV